MKNVPGWILAVTLSVAFLFAGCGTRPEQEINNAQGIIEDLKNQGASLYLNEGFEQLNNELTVIMAEIEAQDKKLIRSYVKSKEMLAQMMENAENLGQILQMINDARSVIDEISKKDAALYAANEMRIINDDFSMAINEIKQQYPLPDKNFERAEDMLASVKNNAKELAPVISGRKEEARNRALIAQKYMQDALDEANKTLDMAGSSPEIDAFALRLKIHEDSANDIQGAIDAEEYLSAFEKATLIKENIIDIHDQVKKAVPQIQTLKKPQ
ncbi:hypothetical protein JXL19_00085 [bacterium]|nr:hypothetical protein [bacterium]